MDRLGLGVDPVDASLNQIDSRSGEFHIGIRDGLSGDQTGHHMGERSSDDEFSFLTNDGNLDAGHQLSRQHGRRRAHAAAANYHQSVSCLHRNLLCE